MSGAAVPLLLVEGGVEVDVEEDGVPNVEVDVEEVAVAGVEEVGPGSATGSGSEHPYELDQPTWELLVRHAWSDYPYEVCGLLGTRPDGSHRHYPIDNADRSVTTYTMDGKQLLQAMREIEDEGWELAIYHSHTHTHAYPSATDVRLAAYPDATYLIVTLQDRDHPDIRAFRIRDGEVAERELVRRDRQVA